MMDPSVQAFIQQELARLRAGFLAEAPRRLSELRAHLEAWEAGDVQAAQALGTLVHTLRGTGGTLGLHRASRLAAEIEERVESGGPTAPAIVGALLEALEEAFERPEPPASSASEPPPRPIPTGTSALLVLPDPLLGEALARELQAYGVSVEVVEDDAAAVRALSAERGWEWVVVEPGAHGPLRTHIRSAGRVPPLFVELFSPEAPNPGRPYADARLPIGGNPLRLARELLALRRSAPWRFRALAVDDDPSACEALRAVLEPAGVEVLTLPDGEELFATLQRTWPDVLLLDVQMPGLDGFELLQRVRSEPAWRHLTILLHTSRNEVADRVRAFELGVDDYLPKPVDARELRARMLGHLRRRARLRAALERDVSTGLGTPDLLTRALARHLDERGPGGEALPPLSVALLRPPAPVALPALAALLGRALRPSDVIARWDERTLACVLPASRAQDALGFLQSAGGPYATERTAVDTLTHPGASAQALLLAAELALAALKGPEAPAATTALPPPPAAPLRRVLVVDDDASLRQLLQRLLEREGYEVTCASDGEEALQQIASGRPELMLLDLHMPRRSGLDVLKAMAERPERPRTLMLSAQARDADVVRALERGAADFVAKPFSTATLLARLARLARAPERPPDAPG